MADAGGAPERSLLEHPCPDWCTGVHAQDPPREPESWHHEGPEHREWLPHGVGTDGEALVQLVQYPFATRREDCQPYVHVFATADGGQHTPEQLAEFADAVERYVRQVRALVAVLERDETNK